jgi:NAD(P)-dependent dehydrogenase (short-subunit alcohol dehydrogenase family)
MIFPHMGWTTADIPGQAGRVAVVTGATSGIGFHTARGLAGAGAEVVLAVRDVERGERARAETGAAAVVRLDLAEQASVRAAAAELVERWPRIDVLVNNAGVMALPRRVTVDGFELQMATNHLGPFALTGLLLDALETARVVTVSSGAHRGARSVSLNDPARERRYHRWPVYSETKLANLLFMFELGRRATAAGLGLTSVAAHPGMASTNLQAAGPRMDGSRLYEAAIVGGTHLLGQSDAAGALPSLYAATMPLESGTYVGPGGPFEIRGRPKVVSASGPARDAEAARRLWEASERLTGVTYL